MGGENPHGAHLATARGLSCDRHVTPLCHLHDSVRNAVATADGQSAPTRDHRCPRTVVMAPAPVPTLSVNVAMSRRNLAEETVRTSRSRATIAEATG
jgi:hypothetical protein